MTAVSATDREFARQRNIALGIALVFLAFSLLLALFGRAKGPDVDPYLAAAAIAWAIFDWMTAVFLFTQANLKRRFDFGIIASAYGLNGLLTIPYIGSYFGLFGTADRTVSDQQLPATFYIIWHLVFPLAITSVYLLRSESGGPTRPPLLERTNVLVPVTIAFAGLVTWLCFSQSSLLPHFVVQGIFQPAYWAIGMPLVILINCLATVVLAFGRRRPLGSLQIWLALTMFTSCLDGLMNESTTIRFSYAWDFGKIMTLSTSTIVMVRMLYEIMRMYVALNELTSLQTHRAAARIRAIWQIVTSESLSEGDYIQVILDVATANLRPRNSVFGCLSHLESGQVIIDAVSDYGDDPSLAASHETYQIGKAIGLGDDVHALIYAGGRTATWENRDIPTSFLAASVGWESLIGTPIQIGTQTHFLVFGILLAASSEPLTEIDGAFIDVVASNISHRFYQRSQLERVRYHIEHDGLTGLYNRAQFLRTGRMLLAAGKLAALILVNLDNFSSVNKQVGQLVADDLLIEIATSLRAVDAGDLVCRIAGDEFAILLPTDSGEWTLPPRADAYMTVFSRAFPAGDRDGIMFVPVAASLGVAAAEDGVSFDELLQRASVALGDGKQTNRGRATTYSRDLADALHQRAMQRDELLLAIEDEQFRLNYQPTFDLNTGAIVSAEALIRWQHPTRGLIGPGEFLDAAKINNAMRPITLWVVHRIARDLRRIDLPDGFRCYFNVTAPVLEDATFIVDLERELEDFPGLNEALGLEVTESEVMNKVERAIETLTAVRRMGLRVSIDDFGTGYSSLSYLKRLPVDAIKLDRSYISGLPDNPSDVALAEVFLELTKRFELTSVAEGVETQGQADWLREHGCQLVQGFLFSRPMRIDGLVQSLETQSRTALPSSSATTMFALPFCTAVHPSEPPRWKAGDLTS